MDIQNNGLGLGSLSALTTLSSLTSLDVGNNVVRTEVISLTNLGLLTSLKSLTLTNTNIDHSNHRILYSLSSLTSLTRLGLKFNLLEDEGAKVLASLETLTSLTCLNLGYNHNIGIEGAKALLTLTSLKYLNLKMNNIGIEGATILRERVLSFNKMIHFPVKSLYHLLLEYSASTNLQCEIDAVRIDLDNPEIIKMCEGRCRRLKTNLQECLVYKDEDISWLEVCCRRCIPMIE